MRVTAYFAAMALAGGALVFGGCKDDDTTKGPEKSPGEKAGEIVRKGVDATTKAADDLATKAQATLSPIGTDKLENVRDVTEGIVQNVFKENEWDDMADHFTEADEKRVMAGKPNTAEHDRLAKAFIGKWKAKYGDDFTVMDNDQVFTAQFMPLTTGTPSGDVKRAAATIVKSHGLPELKLTFVGEATWELDIPDEIDSAKLFDNLHKALNDLQDESKWPADKMEAYRHVSHRILLAVTHTGGDMPGVND